MSKEKDDSIAVQFQASRRSDGRLFSLEVTCIEPLTDDEYADCLVAFANDIRMGEFAFDEARNETFSQ